MNKLYEPSQEEVVQTLLELQSAKLSAELRDRIYTISRDVTRPGAGSGSAAPTFQDPLPTRRESPAPAPAWSSSPASSGRKR
jgi:hypothetical protein